MEKCAGVMAMFFTEPDSITTPAEMETFLRLVPRA